MKTTSWREIETIFNKAIEIPTDERVAYVENSCGTDQELKEEVLSLIAETKNTDEWKVSDSVFEIGLMVLAQEIDSLLAEPEFSKYELIKILGRGANAVVFLAFDTQLERNVAIKVFHESYINDLNNLTKLKREAKIASNFSNPYTVHIYDFGVAKDRFYLVMEFVEGESLLTLLSKNTLNSKSISEIAIQVVKVLDFIHKKNFIHRDIKPENIIVSERNSIKLLDFGLAKSLNPYENPDSEKNFQTVENMVSGTSAYMSPEQLRAEKLDYRTDYWSFGVVLYEMIYKVRPFTGKTRSDIHANILLKEPNWETTDWEVKIFHGVLKKLLSKNISERYQSADNIIEDLRKNHLKIVKKGKPGNLMKTLKRLSLDKFISPFIKR